MKLEEKYIRGEQTLLPAKLCVQMDNASDNKSKTMMAFATHLVEKSIFEQVEPIFLRWCTLTNILV